MNELPIGWIKKELGEIASSIKGKKPKNSSHSYSEKFTYPYINIKAFEGRGIDEYTDGIKCSFCNEDDVLIVWDGARFGLVGRGIKGAIGSTLAKFESDCLDNSFLFYFLFSKYNYIQSRPKGVGIPHVDPNILWNIETKIPPLNEQHRIVAKIEELFTKLDAAKAELEKAKSQVKRYRQSVLKAAFEVKLTNENVKNGELPEGWEWKELKNITSILGDGLHGTPKYTEDGDFHFINGNNLNDGKIIFKENTKRVDVEEYEKYKKNLNDQTIFVSINGTLGNTAFYNGEKIILGKSACYFNVTDEVDKYYLRYCLKSEYFVNYAHKTATGSTIKNVSLKAMREFKIPVPQTKAEQYQIVEEIESRFSIADKVEEEIEANLKRLESLRQSILKQAFEGKLVPQDPSDEPAGKLLERIKGEKLKNKTKV